MGLNNLQTGGTGGISPGGLRNLTEISVIPDSAIHQWKFAAGSGTTTVDSIGSLDGTVDGATWVTDSDYVGGEVLSFDGSDDQITHSSSFGGVFDLTTPFSFALTFNTGDPSVNQNMLGFSNNDVSLGISINSGNAAVKLSDGSNTLQDISGSISPNTNYRLFYTYDGSSGALYLNGSEVTGGTQGFANATNGFTIGSRQDDSVYFGGFIDNVIVFDVAEDGFVTDDYNSQPWS